MQIRLLTLLTVIIISLTGCATSRVSGQDASPDSQTQLMYPVSESDANAILVEAMQYQFPDASIVRVELPYKGYFVTRRFLLDSHDFTARMIPTKGRQSDGTAVDGFRFEVIDHGTMLISGPVRGSSLFNKITELANKKSKGLPLDQ